MQRSSNTAETDFDDLALVGLKDFNPMWTFPRQLHEPELGAHLLWHGSLSSQRESGHERDALVSQSPIVVFKAAMVLQSLGIIASRIVLLGSDVKGGKKNRTYCPTTWNYAYIDDTPASYSDQL